MAEQKGAENKTELVEETKTRSCKVCQIEQPLENFPRQLLTTGRHDATTYHRHECKACAKKRRDGDKKTGFLAKVSDTELALMQQNKAQFNTLSAAKFHKLCGLKIGLQSFYRYIRLGEVQKAIN